MAEFSNPEAYELWMGRWSDRLAPAFVRFAGPPESGRVLDVGSGTGALAAALLADVADVTVVGIEPAEAYVAYSSARLRDERLHFEVGDALAIPFEDDGFDAALSLLILQELLDAPRAVREMRRVTRPGGRIAASQWDFADGMPMLALFWDAVVEVVDSDAARRAAADCLVVDHPDEGALRRLWHDAGLVEIVTERHEIAMDFTAFDDYWAPFLSGVTPTSSFAGGLGEDQRAAVEDRLRQTTVGPGPDRPFTLPARAWAVRGAVPMG